MSIKIGDKNKIKHSSIGHQYNLNMENKRLEDQKFHEKHPILTGFFISIISGIIVLFSFWEKSIQWLENLLR